MDSWYTALHLLYQPEIPMSEGLPRAQPVIRVVGQQLAYQVNAVRRDVRDELYKGADGSACHSWWEQVEQSAIALTFGMPEPSFAGKLKSMCWLLFFILASSSGGGVPRMLWIFWI